MGHQLESQFYIGFDDGRTGAQAKQARKRIPGPADSEDFCFDVAWNTDSAVFFGYKKAGICDVSFMVPYFEIGESHPLFMKGIGGNHSKTGFHFIQDIVGRTSWCLDTSPDSGVADRTGNSCGKLVMAVVGKSDDIWM